MFGRKVLIINPVRSKKFDFLIEMFCFYLSNTIRPNLLFLFFYLRKKSYIAMTEKVQHDTLQEKPPHFGQITAKNH